MFYADNGKWISAGKKIANTDDTILFENMPAGTLYWLRNLTKGQEERIFYTRTDNKNGGKIHKYNMDLSLFYNKYMVKPFIYTELLYGLICFLYILSPYSLRESIVPNQVSVVYITQNLLIILLALSVFRKIVVDKIRIININLFDTILICYLLYLYFTGMDTIQMEVKFEIISLCIIYVTIRNCKTEFYRYYLLLLPLSGIIYIFHSVIYQTNLFSPDSGLLNSTGYFFNTGIWGGFISFVTIISIGLLTEKSSIIQNNITKYTLILLVPLYIYLLLVSNSKSAIIACTLGCTILFYKEIQLFLYKYLKNKILIIAVLFICLLILCAFAYYYKENSANGRLLIWSISACMIKDNFLFGHGINGFKQNYMNYQYEYFTKHFNTKFTLLADDNILTFSDPIKILIEQGFIGLVIVISLLFTLFVNVRYAGSKKDNEVVYLTKIIIISWITFSCFSYPSSIFQLLLTLVLYIAILASFQNSLCKFRLTKINISLLIILSVVCSGIFFYYNKHSVRSYYSPYHEWNKSIRNYNIDKATSINNLQAILPSLNNSESFLNSYGKILNYESDYKNAITLLKKSNDLVPSYYTLVELGKNYEATGNDKEAEQVWRKATYMVPNRFEPYFLLIKLYQKQGNSSKVELLSSLFLQKKVKIESVRLTDMIEEVKDICANKID